MTVFHAVMFCIATAPPPSDWQGSSANYPTGTRTQTTQCPELSTPKKLENITSFLVSDKTVRAPFHLCANTDESVYLDCLCATETVNTKPGRGRSLHSNKRHDCVALCVSAAGECFFWSSSCMLLCAGKICHSPTPVPCQQEKR